MGGCSARPFRILAPVLKPLVDLKRMSGVAVAGTNYGGARGKRGLLDRGQSVEWIDSWVLGDGITGDGGA